MSQQPMFPQISTEELCKTQSRDDKPQPLIQYLKDGTLPNDAQTAEKLIRQEGQYFLSGNDILYKQSFAGKENCHLIGSTKNSTKGDLTLVILA